MSPFKSFVSTTSLFQMDPLSSHEKVDTREGFYESFSLGSSPDLKKMDAETINEVCINLFKLFPKLLAPVWDYW